MTKKGQHFLTDDTVVKKVISYVDFSKRPIIEIGGGKGSLTSKLKPDLTIEIDSKFLPYLRDYNLVIADALFPPFLRGQIVSSLPYYITSDFMLNMVKHSQITRMVLILQKDFVDKVVGEPSYISYVLNFHFKIFPKDVVSPYSFFPRPKVFSQIVVFERERDYDPGVDSVLKCISSYKNKKLSSAAKLCGLIVSEERKVREFKPWQVIELLNSLGIKSV